MAGILDRKHAGGPTKFGSDSIAAPIAFLVLLATFVLLLARSWLESSLWVDETYSVLLTTFPVGQLIELTARDSTPPAYYLLLKSWFKIARQLGLEPGVVWARLLNMGAWCLLGFVTWRVGKKLFGEVSGLVVLAVVMGSASMATMVRDIRAYGLASVCLFLAFLSLLEISHGLSGSAPRRRSSRRVLWLLFASLASLALWMQLLSAIILAFLVVLWEVLFLPPRGERVRILAELGVASSAAVLLFAPWLPRVGQQLSYINGSGWEWMTPPTVRNLLRVFTYWLPFGRISPPETFPNHTVHVLGLLAFTVPLGVILATTLTRRTQMSFQTRSGLLALGVGISSVLLFWLLARLELAATFHGPRYPLLATSFIATGLALLCAEAGRWMRWRPALVWFCLAPWLCAGLWGQLRALREEEAWGIAPHLHNLASFLPRPGEPVFLTPSALCGFYRRTFGDYTVLPLEDLPSHVQSGGNATVVRVSPWQRLDKPQERIAREFLKPGILAPEVKRWTSPQERPDYQVWRLSGLRRETLEMVRATGFRSKAARATATASSRALPENQVTQAGWSFLEIGPSVTTSRWSRQMSATLDFDRDLAAGGYLLHLQGARRPFPADHAKMRLRLRGSSFVHEWTQASGAMNLVLRVDLADPLSQPQIEIEHPIWSPARVDLSSDPRNLGFLFRAAWFEPAAEE